MDFVRNSGIDVVAFGLRGADVFAQVQGIRIRSEQVKVFVPAVCSRSGVAVRSGCRVVRSGSLCVGVGSQKSIRCKIICAGRF